MRIYPNRKEWANLALSLLTGVSNLLPMALVLYLFRHHAITFFLSMGISCAISTWVALRLFRTPINRLFGIEDPPSSALPPSDRQGP